jgi:hypothetical protein
MDEPPERDKGQPARRLLVRSCFSHAMGYAQRRRCRAGAVRDLSRAGCDGARSQAPGQAHVRGRTPNQAPTPPTLHKSAAANPRRCVR